MAVPPVVQNDASPHWDRKSSIRSSANKMRCSDCGDAIQGRVQTRGANGPAHDPSEHGVSVNSTICLVLASWVSPENRRSGIARVHQPTCGTCLDILGIAHRTVRPVTTGRRRDHECDSVLLLGRESLAARSVPQAAFASAARREPGRQIVPPAQVPA